MAYEYDVFISYRHVTAAKLWVRDTFVPELRAWLDNSLPHQSKIFLDSESIRAGMNWHAALKAKLLSSKCLIAVLNAPYFSSDYCIAEWHTFVAREKALGLGTQENPKGLIIPIKFFDGIHYAKPLGSKQPIDMTSWGSTAPAFRESQAFIDFQKAVQDLASDLADQHGPILNPPPQRDDWPVVFPPEDPTPKMQFPAV